NRSDTGAIGADETIVGQGLTESGVYTVRLSVKDYASNNNTPYVFTFTASRADSSIEMERNNEITSANVMRGETVRGRIYPEGDVDFFTYIVGEDPRFVTVRLVPPDNVNARMHLFDAAGEKMFEIDNAETGMAEIIPAVFAEGRIFVQVEAFAGEIDADKYYTLSVEPSAYQDNVEIEPNDEKEQATLLSDGIMYGFSTFHGDTDFYLLETEDRQEVSFRITGAPGASSTVSVTDNLGYIINSYPVEGEEIVEFTELVNRRAYLKVDAQRENYTQPYIIETFTQGQ
ncbi:MAG: hypothetical protein ACOC2H_03490, partial [Spirochaetota bacterium]